MVLNWLHRWSWPIRQSRRPDLLVGDPSDPYLRRWWVIPRNFLFNIYLHEIRKSDDDRALHDHPWWNLSWIISGHYVEHTPEGAFDRYSGDWVFRFGRGLHRLEVPAGGPHVVSLFITGPRYRNWGFACPRGWVPWEVFCSPANKGVVGRGCD